MDKKDFDLLGKPGQFVATPEDAKLESFDNEYRGRDFLIQFNSFDFTSLCPVTGQPDFAKIEIKYIPDAQCIETKSLKYYLHSFRNTQAFNEKIVNTIANDLIEACNPKWLKVKGEFAARGGIALTAVVEHPTLSNDEK